MGESMDYLKRCIRNSLWSVFLQFFIFCKSNLGNKTKKTEIFQCILVIMLQHIMFCTSTHIYTDKEDWQTCLSLTGYVRKDVKTGWNADVRTQWQDWPEQPDDSWTELDKVSAPDGEYRTHPTSGRCREQAESAEQGTTVIPLTAWWCQEELGRRN